MEELTYREKYRAEQMEIERKHRAWRKVIHASNEKTKERRALKLQQEKNETFEQRMARKFEKKRKYAEHKKLIKQQHKQQIQQIQHHENIKWITRFY